MKARSVLLLAFGGLLAAAAAPVDAGELHTERSLYRNIVVYDDNGLRCMKFGRHAAGRQTCMALADRDRLVFDYTRMMMAALYLNASPQRVLIIGLGGGTLPSALQKILPAARIDAVEIDPAVVRVAGKYFGFTPGRQTAVFEEDGRVFVKRMQKQQIRYDLVLLDAFDHDYIPEHLLTREFLLEVRGILAPGGVVAANTFATSRLYHSESATYFSAFGEFYRLKTHSRVILVRPGGLPDRDELARNAGMLEDRLRPFGVGSEWLLPQIEVESGWPPGTRVLTDQYSPSNLLNATN